MKITIPYEFSKMVIPPRCRKARAVKDSASITLTIHEVTGDEAPVAIRQHRKKIYDEDLTLIEYRWWRRALWVRHRFQRYAHAPWETQTSAEFVIDPYPFSPGRSTSYYREKESQQERRKNFRQWASSVLLIDGERWEQASEPRYVIYTFGLGHNHGGWGTSLSADNHYNQNISKNRYFRIDQFEQAIKAATQIAINRGDTKSLPLIEVQGPDRFDILIPEAVRLQPAKEHGDGDPFINKIEGVIEQSADPMTAGLLTLVTLGKELSR